MNISIIVPVHKRSPWAAVCLESLAACEGVEHVDVIVSEDISRRSQQQVLEMQHVLATSPLKFRHIRRSTRGPWDNSYSFLREAQQSSSELIIVVEEDMLVTRDFIHFHEQAHEQFNPFTVIGDNNWTRHDCNPAGVVLSKDFSSRAWSIRRKNLYHILNAVDGTKSIEDIVLDLLVKSGWTTVYPTMPRAYTIDWQNPDASLRAELSIESAREVAGRIVHL